MKIIISESQLKQIIESEEKKENLIPKDKLISFDASTFLKQYNTILKKYKSKEDDLDGIKIKGNLDLTELDLEDIEKILNEVVVVTGYLNLAQIPITSLGKLKIVGEELYLPNCKQLTSLGNLTEVGNDLFISNTAITSLGNLKKIGGTLKLSNNTTIESLGELEKVGYDLILDGTELINSLDKLEEVGYDLILTGSYIKSLGKLKKVGINLNLKNTPIESLGKLEYVGGNLNLTNTNISSFGKLKEVGSLFIGNTPLSDMSDENIKNQINVGFKINRDS